MKNFEMILCGVDFSSPSEHALELAADLARRHACPLTVAHVHVPPTLLTGDAAVAAHPELFEQAEHEAERELERCRLQAQQLLDSPVRAEMLRGAPAEALVAWAHQHPCDVIVVATQGRTGLGRLLLGSVAEKVVRTAPCSVLVARATAASGDD
jgi:nucleotide-binding universal stress UspA family protein